MDQSKPVRILHVTGCMNRAGTETLLMNIYRNINKQLVQFDFISYSTEAAHYDEEIQQMGGKVIKLTNPHSVKELYHSIKTHGPYAAVHGHLAFHCGITALAARLAGVKIRVSHAHTTLDEQNGIARKLYLFLMKTLIKKLSTHLLSCSAEAASFLYGRKSERRDNYYYFPNVIDFQKFLTKPSEEVSSFKKEHGLNDTFVIGHIGRFTESKNHRFLLRILKEMLQRNISVKLLLVGTGETYATIQDIAQHEQLTNHIVFAGVREDIPIMLHCMDVFVFPSHFEGLGLVLLEAQAAGIPCIVSENIQPEADLGLHLMHRVSLQSAPSLWVDRILQHGGQILQDENLKMSHFRTNGNDSETAIHTLMNIYQLSVGENA